MIPRILLIGTGLCCIVILVHGCSDVPTAVPCPTSSDDVSNSGDSSINGDGDSSSVCASGCDDGDDCTVDTCDPVKGCQHAAVTCTDGQVCARALATDPTLMGRWKMDNCDGRDSGPHGLNATMHGTLGCIAGAEGNGLALDGTTTWLDVENQPPLDVTLTELSMGGWARGNNTTDYTILVNKEESFEMGYVSGQIASAIAIQNPNGWAWFSKGDFSQQTWHHVVVTYDGKQVTHFVDGVQVAQTARTGTIARTACRLSLGARGEECSGAGKFVWRGDLDEMFVFSRALTAAEIKRIGSKAANAWTGGCVSP